MFHEDTHRGEKLAKRESDSKLTLTADYVIDANRRVVTVKFGKTLAMSEVERYANLLRSNPEFRPQFSEIVDLTSVESVGLEADDFLHLADKADPFSLEARRAFVARTPLQKHAARMHKILRSARNIEIFDTVEAAERWISS